MKQSDLVKVSDDLVEKPQTLDALVITLQLHVEFGKVRDRRKHHAHILTALVVQLLQTEGATI